MRAGACRFCLAVVTPGARELVRQQAQRVDERRRAAQRKTKQRRIRRTSPFPSRFTNRRRYRTLTCERTSFESVHNSSQKQRDKFLAAPSPCSRPSHALARSARPVRAQLMHAGASYQSGERGRSSMGGGAQHAGDAAASACSKCSSKCSSSKCSTTRKTLSPAEGCTPRCCSAHTHQEAHTRIAMRLVVQAAEELLGPSELPAAQRSMAGALLLPSGPPCCPLCSSHRPAHQRNCHLTISQ